MLILASVLRRPLPPSTTAIKPPPPQLMSVDVLGMCLVGGGGYGYLGDGGFLFIFNPSTNRAEISRP
jgi:hypothetical protein